MASALRRNCALSTSASMKNVSFSQSVKDEILKSIKKLKGCCATSFLYAILKSAGSLSLDSFGRSVSVESDNGALAEFCARLAEQQFDVGSAMFEIRNEKDDKTRYVLKFDIELGEKLGLTKGFEPQLQNECCRRAFLQGLFLSCGSCTVPHSEGAFSESKSAGYHLELRFSDPDFADFAAEKFPELGFGRIDRKNNVVLYLKDSEKIADFFVLCDAINAKFSVENIIIERSYRNTANRQRNCIDSNIDKAVSASLRQLAAVEKLKKEGKFETLPPQLKQIAEVREQNPDANLSEIAALLGISKSGANHRLTRLTEIAGD